MMAKAPIPRGKISFLFVPRTAAEWGIFMNIIPLHVGYMFTNCYILCDETEKVCAVVDPGGSPEKILSAVEESGCALKFVCLTHGHYDHTGAVEALRQAIPGLPVYLNRRDIYPLDDPKAQHLYPHIDDTTDYDEGDTLTLGSLPIRVLATPGHSEGGISLLAEDALFCGDTLFAASMGRTDLLGGSDEAIMASLRRLAALPGNLKVLPGHMKATELDREREYNPYMKAALAREK